MIQRNSPGRRGFTLLELIVVMTIIAIIASLSMGVYFRVRQSQTESAAVTTVNKLQSQLDQQWKAVLDNARDDARAGKIGTIATTTLGGGDSRRELVIWTKIQLKLEFPMTFDEAVNWPATVGVNPKSSYFRAIQAAGITPATNLQEDQKLLESAVLFYMAVTQGRRGVAGFNPIDHLGPHAVGDVVIPHYNSSTSFKVFLDSWGQPITFIRWPTAKPNGQPGNPADEINAAPFATFGKISTYNNGNPFVVDPQDPENTLFLNWNAASQNTFKQLIHPLGNVPVNLSPIVMSAGRDKVVNTIGGNPYVHYGVATDFSLAQTQYDPTAEQDNIYGFRSRGVGRH